MVPIQLVSGIKVVVGSAQGGYTAWQPPPPRPAWRTIHCTSDGVLWPRGRGNPPATPAGRWRVPDAARQLGGGRLAAPRRPGGRRASDGTTRARAGKINVHCEPVDAAVPFIASAGSVVAPVRCGRRVRTARFRHSSQRRSGWSVAETRSSAPPRRPPARPRRGDRGAPPCCNADPMTTLSSRREDGPY